MVNVRLPKDFKEKVKAKAQREGVKMSALIYHALRDYLNDRVEIRYVLKTRKSVSDPTFL